MRIDRREALCVSGALCIAGFPRAAGATATAKGDWVATLCPESGVLGQLSRAGSPDFSFVPVLRGAAAAGQYALGDCDIRYRNGTGWLDVSTAFHRAKLPALPLLDGEFAALDVTPALPPSTPFAVERRWAIDGNAIVLRIVIRNRSNRSVEIGGLGFAMVFDNILTERTLEQAHAAASFTDPYIGLDAGHVQVTRLNGKGPALLVLPERGTPLEAWAPISDGDGLLRDRTKRSLTFEGFYRWMVASKGFAEREWQGAEQWNTPTSFTLAAGESRSFGLRLVASPSIRALEETRARAGMPLAIGVPGYVVPTDLPADLFVKASGPVRSMEVHPEGALTVSAPEPAGTWQRYRITGQRWGRARLTLVHHDGMRQTVHYFVTRPFETVVGDLGRFLFTRQWYENPADRFGRSPSVMSYDRERNAVVTEDKRVWIAGLSDEGGAGGWLAAIMKQLDNPDPAEVAKFERFHVEVIERRLQVPDGPETYGVRKSLFHYDPARPQDYDPAIDWTSWASWKPDQAASVARSFNYVHVAAAQWVLYRLARNHVGLVHAHDWRWYLDRALQTTLAMARLAPDYLPFGQMEGDVFVAILSDLRREGWTEKADALEAMMRTRADRWRGEAYPFGSEMPWDSTGQEEVYAWMRHFGDDAKAALTREVILGYDPLVPHWGYNGSARRYWDFLYAGKVPRIERQLHHYGSSINALPLFDSYRRDPADFHLLRVAYGGLMGH